MRIIFRWFNFEIGSYSEIKYIDLGIKLDSNKYQQKFPHIYVVTKWMTNNYFFAIKFIYSAWNLYILLELASESWIYRCYDKKVVISHPLCHNINMWKLLLILVVIYSEIYRQNFWKKLQRYPFLRQVVQNLSTKSLKNICKKCSVSINKIFETNMWRNSFFSVYHNPGYICDCS